MIVKTGRNVTQNFRNFSSFIVNLLPTVTVRWHYLAKAISEKGNQPISESISCVSMDNYNQAVSMDIFGFPLSAAKNTHT